MFAALCVVLGGVYGFAALGAFSGFAPLLVLLVVGFTLLALSAPLRPRLAASSGGALVAGFAAIWAWALVVAGSSACCGLWADVAWACGFLAAALAPAAGIWWGRWRLPRAS